MINVCFDDHSKNVEPLSAQRIIAELLGRGAKFFVTEPESISLRLDVDEEIVTFSGAWREMGALSLFCQAAIDGCLEFDWRDPDDSLPAHLLQKKMHEELACEF
jgi:hypothetical protein